MKRAGTMRSVSTFTMSSGTATAVRIVKGCMGASGKHLSHVGDRSAHCGSGGHRRAHEMGSRTLALASLEITIGGRCTPFARSDEISVHADAHGASGIAPLESGVAE